MNCQAIILDGEVVVWDLVNRQFAQFGKNKAVARQNELSIAEDVQEQNNLQLCFKVFDCLFYKASDPTSPEV